MIYQMSLPVQGALRQEKKFEIIANNIANADTNGFKGDSLVFDQLLRTRLVTDFSPGELQTTSNKLDLAIGGDGFFKVQTPQGVRYTRNGGFALNQAGMLVSSTGDLVLGQNGPISLEGRDITVSSTGQVQVDGEPVDTLSIVSFADKEKLLKEGNSLFRYEGNPGDEILPDQVNVLQGTLEKPNIQTVVEMARMIETMRTYEALQKAVHTIDETDQKVIGEVGRPL